MQTLGMLRQYVLGKQLLSSSRPQFPLSTHPVAQPGPPGGDRPKPTPPRSLKRAPGWAPPSRARTSLPARGPGGPAAECGSVLRALPAEAPAAETRAPPAAGLVSAREPVRAPRGQR